MGSAGRRSSALLAGSGPDLAIDRQPQFTSRRMRPQAADDVIVLLQPPEFGDLAPLAIPARDRDLLTVVLPSGRQCYSIG